MDLDGNNSVGIGFDLNAAIDAVKVRINELEEEYKRIRLPEEVALEIFWQLVEDLIRVRDGNYSDPFMAGVIIGKMIQAAQPALEHRVMVEKINMEKAHLEHYLKLKSNGR